MTKDDVYGANKVLYGDLLKIDSDNREYEEIKDMGKLIKILEDKLDDYNTECNSKTRLVFFSDAIDHVLRISRILR
jgi:dynein heavy chain